MCCVTGLCSSCDVSSASVQMMEAVDQDLDAEDAGKLTEADKAHTGRVGLNFINKFNVNVLFNY